MSKKLSETLPSSNRTTRSTVRSNKKEHLWFLGTKNWLVGTERTDVLLCSHDYLKIFNENNEPFGVYCGRNTGKTVVLTGKHVVMTFHSDRVVQKRGFLLLFTAFQPGEYNHEVS